MLKIGKTMRLLIPALIAALIFSACALASPASDSGGDMPSGNSDAGASDTAVRSAVDFEHELDSYEPLKDRYNFYFTYKTVHSWWDAVALGMEEAQRQYLDRGITITYEYMAPDVASADDQRKKLLDAEQKDYDVIGVDVADESVISPLLDEMVDSGKKVMTFSSSDAAAGCKRIAYVGNTHNYQDGADLTEAICEKLGYKGKIAILVGSVGAPTRTGRGARGIPSPNTATWKSSPPNTTWIPWIWPMI